MCVFSRYIEFEYFTCTLTKTYKCYLEIFIFKLNAMCIHIYFCIYILIIYYFVVLCWWRIFHPKALSHKTEIKAIIIYIYVACVRYVSMLAMFPLARRISVVDQMFLPYPPTLYCCMHAHTHNIVFRARARKVRVPS